MLFNYKLSNLSLSVTFCFLILRRVWVPLGMSKLQKPLIFGQNLHVIGLYEIFHGFKGQIIVGKG